MFLVLSSDGQFPRLSKQEERGGGLVGVCWLLGKSDGVVGRNNLPKNVSAVFFESKFGPPPIKNSLIWPCCLFGKRYFGALTARRIDSELILSRVTLCYLSCFA